MKRIIATLAVFLGERGHIVFRPVLTVYNAPSCTGWIKFTVGKTSEEILAWTEPFAQRKVIAKLWEPSNIQVNDLLRNLFHESKVTARYVLSSASGRCCRHTRLAFHLFEPNIMNAISRMNLTLQRSHKNGNSRMLAIFLQYLINWALLSSILKIKLRAIVLVLDLSSNKVM